MPEEKDKRPNTMTSFMWLEPKWLIHTHTLVLVLRVMVLVFFSNCTSGRKTAQP